MGHKYQLETPVRMQVLWLIRDYERITLQYNNMLDSSPVTLTGVSVGNSISKPTENKAIKRAEYSKKIDAIDYALELVPEEYREGIWNNILYRSPYPYTAGETTYRRWKARFLYKVAERLYMI